MILFTIKAIKWNFGVSECEVSINIYLGVLWAVYLIKLLNQFI